MGEPIAIIGMSGRFPKARNLERFWELLRDGVEVIEQIPERIIDSRRDSRGRLPPEFVPRGTYLEDTEYFDCGLFGVGVRDAKIMDPQQRLFIEHCWAAAEDAGYEIGKLGRRVAVYGGAGPSRHPLDAMEVFGHDSSSTFEIIATGIDKPMTMRVSHLFDLRGESIYVYAACATSLVAIDLACRALAEGRADAALAGASVLALPQMEGYDYVEGGVRSSDGHCRAFDADGDGTVWGNGVGVVALKRLADARRDRDRIRAVVIASATNNDGAGKVSFAAPSCEGQADVIATAFAASGIDPRTIGFVEAHGTGTAVGDPIEVAALNRAFGTANGPGTCVLGSVKTMIGHLDPAAGVAGLIKTVLALEHEAIPPTLHFRRPKPSIDFAAGPFRVNAELVPWPRGERPRRAGINSFGVGGTNAHLVVEEAPAPAPREPAPRAREIVCLSARTPTALAAMRRELGEHLAAHGELELRDVAFTRNAGRRAFAYREAYVAPDVPALVEALRAERPASAGVVARAPQVAFVFPGQGSQALDMALELYAAERPFRSDVDDAAEVLLPLLGRDIREIMYPEPGGEAAAEELLRRTEFQQPVLFAVEYALARLIERWGCAPSFMLGHSVGELVTATLGGSMHVVDALRLVALRGRAAQRAAAGAMLAVPLALEELAPLVPAELDIAAVNAPAECVVSGPPEVIERFQDALSARGTNGIRLRTSHAFHSRSMDAVLDEFREALRGVRLAPPARRWVSNATGAPITDEEATDPEYWVRHLRGTVRFADGVRRIAGADVVLELGGTQALSSTIAQTLAAAGSSAEVFSVLPHRRYRGSQYETLFRALGALWARGVPIDWDAVHEADGSRRIGLPHYPFEGVWVALQPPGHEDAAQRRAQPAAETPRTLFARAVSDERAPRPDGELGPYVAPDGALEAEVASIFGRLLGIDPIGAEDDFFDLGGNSIMLVHVANQVRAVFRLNLSIREIGESSTPRLLAAAIAEKQVAERAGSSA
jgi:acyl transferase domain-containing protein